MSNDNAKAALTPHYDEAHRKGYLAGRRGCTGADNPYDNDSREARTHQLTVVRSD